MSTQAPSQCSPEQVIMQIGSGFWASQCLSVATRLDLFEALFESSRTADDLAKSLSLDPDATSRLLRGCGCFGLVKETEDGFFQLTELGQRLNSQHPQSMRDVVIMLTDPGHWNSWSHLEHTVRTGQPAYQKALGVDNVFEYFAANPSEAHRFDKAMASMTGAFVGAVREVYDLTPFSVIADIGGGHGQLLGNLLGLAPKSKGLLFDQAHVVAQADEQLQKLGVAQRVDKVSGSFFESVPGGVDLYLLKHILHDWTDEQCGQILTNLRQAMAPASKVLIVEMLLPEPPSHSETALMDLNMMVMTGGRERTETEYRRLLEASGLCLARVIPTPGPYHLLEAIRDPRAEE